MPSEPYNVSPGDRLTAGWMNSVVSSIKRRTKPIKGRGIQTTGGTLPSPCAFNTIITKDKKLWLLGGALICGDKTFNIPDYDVGRDNDRTVYLYIKVDLTVNKDDDDQLLLPGVKTATGSPSIQTTSGDYPNGTAPSLPAGTGSIVVPLGKLVVKKKSATFVGSCGNITIGHCVGTLSYTRGG